MSTTGFVPTQNGTLIGLGGKLRAGKDAVGDYLEEKHGFVKLGMSDALNEALLKLNPIIPTGKYWEAGYEHYMTYQDYHAAHGYVKAKENPEVRRLLQVLGTEVGREMIDPDVWVRMAEKKILEHWANGKSVVITAMRFPNEVEMLKRLGGLSVWVERPDEQRYGAKPGENLHIIQAHASENSVSADDFDYVLNNDGTLDQLYRKVEKRIIQREGQAMRLNTEKITVGQRLDGDAMQANPHIPGSRIPSRIITGKITAGQLLDAGSLITPRHLTIQEGETFTVRQGDREVRISDNSVEVSRRPSKASVSDTDWPPYDR